MYPNLQKENLFKKAIVFKYNKETIIIVRTLQS